MHVGIDYEPIPGVVCLALFGRKGYGNPLDLERFRVGLRFDVKVLKVVLHFVSLLVSEYVSYHFTSS